MKCRFNDVGVTYLYLENKKIAAKYISVWGFDSCYWSNDFRNSLNRLALASEYFHNNRLLSYSINTQLHQLSIYGVILDMSSFVAREFYRLNTDQQEISCTYAKDLLNNFSDDIEKIQKRAANNISDLMSVDYSRFYSRVFGKDLFVGDVERNIFYDRNEMNTRDCHRGSELLEVLNNVLTKEGEGNEIFCLKKDVFVFLNKLHGLKSSPTGKVLYRDVCRFYRELDNFEFKNRLYGCVKEIRPDNMIYNLDAKLDNNRYITAVPLTFTAAPIG